MTETTDNSIVLFDGVCSFCNGAVNFIIERDTAKRYKFAPLQSEIGQKLIKDYRLDKIEKLDSVVLIENGTAYTHSTAALRIAGNLNGFWRYFAFFSVVPPVIRDTFYKLFAKLRYQLFGKKDACMMPTPEIRERFL